MYLRASQFLASASLALSALTCSAQSSTPQYGVKEVEAPAGSNIKRYVTSGSHIPINRTYQELSPEEKSAVNTYYEKVEPGDEPPFPLEGLRPIHEAIGKVQQRLLVTGRLILVVSVGADGIPIDVRAVGSPSPAMTKAAASIILLSKFKPALCKGEPCRMEFPFSFAFEVR